MAGAHLSPRVAVDANRRPTSLSPLSRPLDVTSTRPGPSQAPLNRPRTTVAGGATSPALLSGNIDSPAAQQLAELNDKDGKKGVKSRLRRAFSFGSAAELRRASAENNLNMASAERARLRKERYQGEHDAEQAAIAQKQEAAGLGQGIYSGQGVFQSGSTDNLSISSTASSASIMIRKMGKGMKKSTRSLVGLFRPKSVVGAPTADDASVPGASAAQVSMVTVEAEREKVNVNVDPHDQAGGGTGFPRLERNSMDAGELTSAGYSRIARGEGEAIGGFGSRRSIVGGEFERAEVLAAVKKGILKRRSCEVVSFWCIADRLQEPGPDLRVHRQSHGRPMPNHRTSTCHSFPTSTRVRILAPRQLRWRTILRCLDIVEPTRSASKARTISCRYRSLAWPSPRVYPIRLRASQSSTSASALVSSFTTPGRAESTIDVERRRRATA